MAQCINIVRKGGRIGILGQGHEVAEIQTATLSFREIELIGTRAYTPKDWRRVIFGLENASSLFIDRTELMCFVWNQVKSPWMKFVYDVANATMVEPIIPGIERIKDQLVHVHLSDTDGKKWTHSRIGNGKIDFGRVAMKLKEIHFTGISILETTDAEDPDRSISKSVKKLVPFGWHL